MIVRIEEGAGATAPTATGRGSRAILTEQVSRQFASDERLSDTTYSSEEKGRGELVLLNEAGEK